MCLYITYMYIYIHIYVYVCSCIQSNALVRHYVNPARHASALKFALALATPWPGYWPESELTPLPGLLWPVKWTAPSGPLSEATYCS